MVIRRVSVPMGVVAIIYESRPNVTSDAAALALKSGNVCVLRGGKEAFRSANAIVESLREGLVQAGLPRGSALHTLGLLVLAFSTISSAISRSASLST